MKEFYTFNGQTYEIDPSRLQEFEEYSQGNAIKIEAPRKKIDIGSQSGNDSSIF